MNKTNNLMNEETTNSSLRTGSQSTISELPTISPLALTDKTIVENETGTYNTTVGDIVALAAGGDFVTPAELEDRLDTSDNLQALNPISSIAEPIDDCLSAINTNIATNTTNIATNTTNIDAISKAELTPDADVLGTEEILSRKPDGTITTINQSALAGTGGGGVSQAYVDGKDAELQASIDANATNIDLIANAPLTPDADVLGTEEILSRNADGTIITINQSALAGSGGGELPDLTEYAKLEDLDTATNFTAINPTLDTPAPEVLDKVVTDIENEVKTNTTAITDLTGRVTNLENSGGGGGVEFVEPIYIPIVSADINTADASIIVDLSAYPDNTSFCIDIDILDTEAIFTINIIGTDTLNGFLEELYLRGNMAHVESSSTKTTDLFIEGVKIVGILARLSKYKCRYTINGIDNIFYYAKYDENGGYIDAIYTDSNEVSEGVVHGSFETTDTTTFFYALEPLKLKDPDMDIPYTELAYISISLGDNFKYDIDCSILLINSVLSTENPNNKYAQDNVQDYLLIYGRRTYLPNIYFPIVYPDRTGIILSRYLVEGSYSNYIETVSGNTVISLTPYRITAIGRFGKVMDVGKIN